MLHTGNCTQLEVLIDGQMGRTASCVGENVTYVCNVASSAHIWTISGVDMEHTILANTPFEQTVMGFTFQRVQVIDGVLTSSVSVISYPGLDGTAIQCIDGVYHREVHNITASVYGELRIINMTNSNMQCGSCCNCIYHLSDLRLLYTPCGQSVSITYKGVSEVIESIIAFISEMSNRCRNSTLI